MPLLCCACVTCHDIATSRAPRNAAETRGDAARNSRTKRLESMVTVLPVVWILGPTPTEVPKNTRAAPAWRRHVSARHGIEDRDTGRRLDLACQDEARPFEQCRIFLTIPLLAAKMGEH